MTKKTTLAPYEVTGIVGKWLYFKAQLPHLGFQRLDNTFGLHETPQSVLGQIGADVMHSWLLLRMLHGYDPLPQDEYESWKARNFEGGLTYLEERERSNP